MTCISGNHFCSCSLNPHPCAPPCFTCNPWCWLPFLTKRLLLGWLLTASGRSPGTQPGSSREACASAAKGNTLSRGQPRAGFGPSFARGTLVASGARAAVCLCSKLPFTTEILSWPGLGQSLLHRAMGASLSRGTTAGPRAGQVPPSCVPFLVCRCWVYLRAAQPMAGFCAVLSGW